MTIMTSRDDAVVGLIWIMPAEDDPEAQEISAGWHLGCGYLAAWLETLGITAAQIRFEPSQMEQIAAEIAALDLKILGFSVKDTNFYAVRRMVTHLKALRPDILVVFGGLTPTFLSDLLLKETPGADLCVRHYGEQSFGRACELFLAGEDWRAAPGISYLDDGVLVETPMRDVVESARRDLDHLPSPYLTGHIPPKLAPMVGLSTSRGCIFKCVFCNPTAMAGYQIAYHSDDRVCGELAAIDRALAEDPPDEGRILLFLNEDIFALNPERTRRLCARIQALNIQHLEFGCETRIEHLDRETLEAMYAAGFRFLKFGLESANPRVLNVTKKVRDKDGAGDDYIIERQFLQKIRAVVAMGREIGFRMACGTIFGLPGEKLPDAIETLDFVAKLGVDEYYHNYLQLFSGTEAFNQHKAFGMEVGFNEGYYPSIYRTRWAYPVALVPRLEHLTNRSFKRNVVQL
ncbi:MAG: B12-binding domain-containing radical SAM protein [Rhodospirillaceae bacterium]